MVLATCDAGKAEQQWAPQNDTRYLYGPDGAQLLTIKAKKAAIEKAKKEAAQRAKKKAAEQAKRTSDKAVAQTKKTGNPVQKQAQAKAAPKASSVSKGSAGGKSGGSKPGGNSGGSSRSKGGSSGSGGSCPTGNSFVPGTKVLMADGTTKPIEEVEAGDKVVATDPETGETRIETVTAEIKGEGLKHLVKVVIDSDGDKGEKTAEVTATDGHPFWVPELGAWLDATDLQPGQWLRTSAGTHVQITAVERWTSLGATVHNLTVGDTHTYYVLAEDTPVLVHNCGGSQANHSATCTCGSGGQPRLANGTMGSNPNTSANRLDRSNQYPSVYRATTHQAMRAKYHYNGSWRDQYGSVIPDNELTYEHLTAVVDHWNTVGYNTSRAERNDFYNDVANLVPMRRSLNSSLGGGMTARYRQDTGPNYSG